MNVAYRITANIQNKEFNFEGSVTLWQEGKTDIEGKAGEVVKVPLKQIHTARTNDAGAVIQVFRVHQPGKQQRYFVEQSSSFKFHADMTMPKSRVG